MRAPDAGCVDRNGRSKDKEARTMKRPIILFSVVVTALVVGVTAAAAGQAIELRSENAAGQHPAAQPLQLITEHSAGQHVAQAPRLAATTFVAAPTDTSSFSWRDAGLGAAGALVLLLLLSAAFFALYRRGRPAVTHG
jgi:hypothetical protein